MDSMVKVIFFLLSLSFKSFQWTKPMVLIHDWSGEYNSGLDQWVLSMTGLWSIETSIKQKKIHLIEPIEVVSLDIVGRKGPDFMKLDMAQGS